MSDIDSIKAEIKKLNSQATTAKMDLHDLSEDLPNGWEKVMEVASRTYETYAKLAEARARLKAVES